jgi:hypothetical protein
MDYIGVGEHPHYLSDGIRFTNVGEELVSQALTLTGTFDNPGNIHKRHGGGENPLTTENLRQGVQALVGEVHHSDVGLNRGEGIVRCQHSILGQGVEEGGFTDIG